MKFQKVILVALIAFGIFSACRKDDVVLPSYYTGTSGKDSVTKERPATISAMKPTLAVGDSIPTKSQVIRFAIQRSGTNNTAILRTLTGKLLQDIPTDLLSLFTRGNKPLAEIGNINNTVIEKTVSGWNVSSLNYLSANGSTIDVNKQIDAETASKISVVITFYPDGYYTFINNKNQYYNEMGWFQIATENGLPTGVIYNALHSGIDFKSPPRLLSPIQSFGVWGIDRNGFYPLLQLNNTTNIFLKMVPVIY